MLQQMHDRTTEMAVAALDFVGVRYRRGGTSAETGFDCSGFTRHVFENGLTLLVEPLAHVHSVAIGVFVRRGSRHESERGFMDTGQRKSTQTPFRRS